MMSKQIFALIFIAALFTIAKRENKSNSPIHPSGWMGYNAIYSDHIMEYSAIKRNEILI